MHRENQAKMPVAKPNAGKAEKQALAMFNEKHPLHREALHPLGKILPDTVIPESWFDEPPALTA